MITLSNCCRLLVRQSSNSQSASSPRVRFVDARRTLTAIDPRRRRQRKQRRRRPPAGYKGNDPDNKIMFQSLGCPRNFVDTEVMLGTVLKAGLEYTQDPAGADYLVVNTCGFLQSARDESQSAIQELLGTKKEGSKLIVTGCMVNLHKEQILKDYPEVDYVLGSGSMDRIMSVIKDISKGNDEDRSHNKNNDSVTDSDKRKSFLEQGDTPRFLATPPHYAYLKIAEGCRKRCSFCIIPKIKGPLQSKPVDQVVQEFQALLEHGCKEIILIAQDLGDYGKDFSKQKQTHHADDALTSNGRRRGQLETLLKAMLESAPVASKGAEDDFWLRLLYLYPDEITPELVDIMAKDTRICRYLDMPIQHVNDTTLKKMKRTTTGEDIKRTIRFLREKLPDIHIRTSLMVGFPGETEEQFQELVDFVKDYRLENVGAFMYSDEDLAWSSRLPDQISEAVKMDRYDRLMRAQLDVTRERNQQRILNKERLNVVIEGMHDEYDDLIVARYYGQCPDIDGQIIINDVDELGKLPNAGQRYWVELTDHDDYDLIGRIARGPKKSEVM